MGALLIYFYIYKRIATVLRAYGTEWQKLATYLYKRIATDFDKVEFVKAFSRNLPVQTNCNPRLDIACVYACPRNLPVQTNCNSFCESKGAQSDARNLPVQTNCNLGSNIRRRFSRGSQLTCTNELQRFLRMLCRLSMPLATYLYKRIAT